MIDEKKNYNYKVLTLNGSCEDAKTLEKYLIEGWEFIDRYVFESGIHYVILHQPLLDKVVVDKGSHEDMGFAELKRHLAEKIDKRLEELGE